jgi:thiol-disulfide isomerase/thioredoxin
MLEGSPIFELSYKGGRYFVRETFGFLRWVRERKAGEGFVTPKSVLGERVVGIDGASVEGLKLSGWHDAEWFFVASGPDERPVNRVDAVVRLNPVKMAGKGYGVQPSPGPIGYFFHGDTWLMDDGELLAAARTLKSDYEAEVARNKIRDKIRKDLSGAKAPKIDASAWLNADRDLSLEKLTGKVVLLDFWGTWCGPCVKKLPDVQQFADRYASRGVVVIGVHSAEEGETCKGFVKKHGISLPIAIDTGKTATTYGVTEWPSLFVIDKSGKLVSGWTTDLPEDAMVDDLLKK